MLRPHTTYRGRVVYNRPLHPFTENDLLRISKSIVEQSDGEPGMLYKTLRRINIVMMEKILLLFGMEKFADVVVDFMADIVGWILNKLGTIGATKQRDFIAQELSTTVMAYLPEKPANMPV